MEFIYKVYENHPRLTTGLFSLFMSIVSMGTGYASNNAGSDTAHYALMLVAVPSMFVALIAFCAFLLELLYPER